MTTIERHTRHVQNNIAAARNILHAAVSAFLAAPTSPRREQLVSDAVRALREAEEMNEKLGSSYEWAMPMMLDTNDRLLEDLGRRLDALAEARTS